MLILCLGLGLLLTACATSARTPLSVANRAQIQSDQAIVQTKQREINAEIVVSNTQSTVGAATGLIGSLITAAIDTSVNHDRAGKADKKVAPLRNALVNYDFMHKLAHGVNSQLKTVSWLKLKQTKVKYNLQESQIANLVQDSKENTTLLLNVNYDLSPSLNKLIVTVRVNLLEKNPNPAKHYLKLYGNTFVYLDSLNSSKDINQKAITLWTSNNGRRLKISLDKAAHNIAKMISMDMKNPSKDAYKLLQANENTQFLNDYDRTIYGKIISKTSKQMVVRTKNNMLYTVAKSQRPATA